MPSRINLPDLAFALFLIGLGVLALVFANDLRIGRAGAMGPGYVPHGLALIIMAFGAFMAVRAVLAGRQPFPEMAWRPLILIGAAVALFAIALPRAGLAITSVVVVILAGYAAYDVRVRENALLAIGIAIFAVSLFVLALGLPIPIWPPL
jgi:Tripartite tricarboxylate transporter TctB family